MSPPLVNYTEKKNDVDKYYDGIFSGISNINLLKSGYCLIKV